MTGDTPNLGRLFGTYLAKVVSVKDDDGLSRIQVRLLTLPDAIGDADCSVWARVAVPFAGDQRGAFFIPDVGDEVAVTFVNGDPRQPIVIGGLWSGSAKPKETLGGSGDRVDRYTIVGKKGSRIAIIEESDGQAKIEITVPGGVSITMSEDSGGKIELKAAGNTVTLDTQGVSVQAASKFKVDASTIDMTAGQVTVNSALSTFSGVAKADVVQGTTIIGSTYTPGAGNVW